MSPKIDMDNKNPRSWKLKGMPFSKLNHDF